MSENNCDDALEKIIESQKGVFKDIVAEAIKGTTFDDIKNKYEEMSKEVNGLEKNKNSYSWITYYFKNTRMQGFDNINTIKYLNDAIDSRHQALRDINYSEFDTNCNNNVAKVMEDFRRKELNDFDKLNSYMSSLLTSYKHLFDYKSTVKAAYNEKMKTITNIEGKITSYKQNLFIDERKNKYQTDSYDFYKSAHFFVLIIYFSLLALYLIFSDFIKEQRYKERKNIVGLIIYIITPFILAYVLDNIYKIYIFILEYNNIRDDVISYPYIVDKFNKTDDTI